MPRFPATALQPAAARDATATSQPRGNNARVDIEVLVAVLVTLVALLTLAGVARYLCQRRSQSKEFDTAKTENSNDVVVESLEEEDAYVQPKVVELT